MGKNRTLKEKEYLDRLTALGCVVCLRLTGKITPAEVHHIRHGQGTGTKASDLRAIPLCPRHHRAGNYGEAYHSGAKEWQSRYGSEEELLAWIRERYESTYQEKPPG